MTTTDFTRPASVRGFARAAVFAAAVTLGSAACPAIATAEPVWDIEEYDYCMRQTGGTPSSDPIAQEEENDRYCCYRSGGVWNGLTCASPPAKEAGLLPIGPKDGLPTVKVPPPFVAPPNPPMPVLPPKAG